MPMVLKIVVIVFILFIFFALGSALYQLSKGSPGEKMIKALTWRISLSLLLFIFIIITFFFH